MNYKPLCEHWASSLDSWAIPGEILSQAPVSPWKLNPDRFAPSGGRAKSPTVSKIRELLSRARDIREMSIMDIGCGAGGVSLLVLDDLHSLTAVDVSPEMLGSFRRGFDKAGAKDVTLNLVEGSWLDVAKSAGTAGVVVCANVLFNVPQVCDFISKLDEAATIGVVIEIHESHPHSSANAAWKHFWNLNRPDEPTGLQLFEIVTALGMEAQTLTFYRDDQMVREVDDDLVQSLRQRICLDSSRDEEIREFLLSNPIKAKASRLIWWERKR